LTKIQIKTEGTLEQKKAIRILKNQLVQLRSVDKILNHIIYKIKSKGYDLEQVVEYMYEIKEGNKSRRHQLVETLDGNTELGGDIIDEAREEIEYGNKTRS
jgi:outer membrane protein assembly factor BamA|tara:strand:- start:1057 stop:1359 length:303 start_codon:yes stop_codon:yes gene_type:complete